MICLNDAERVGSPTTSRSSVWCCARTVPSCLSSPREGRQRGERGLTETEADPGGAKMAPTDTVWIDILLSVAGWLRERLQSFASNPMFVRPGLRLLLQWEQFDFVGPAERNEHEHRLVACAVLVRGLGQAVSRTGTYDRTQRDEDVHHHRDSRNRVIRPSSVTIPQPIVYQTAM